MNYIKSKQRVADHGEVFTPAWMVEAMLDLVKDFHLLVQLKVFNTEQMNQAVNSAISRRKSCHKTSMVV